MEEIKARCGADFPVALRYSPKSFIKGLRDGALPGEVFEEQGRDLDEGIEAAKLLTAYGYDALDVDVGSYDAWWWSHPPMYQEKGLYIPYAKLVKEAVDVPVFCAGRMDDPDLAAAAVRDGACDVVSLGRPLLADPDYVNKLRMDKVWSIRPCLSCQEGCMGRIQEYSAINCAVNPACSREQAARLVPALKPKKVLIVGGGPAGCEAARVLALRGHKPVLCEASVQLGGNMIPGGAPEFKEDDLALVRWYGNVLADLGVEIRLNTRVTAQDVLTGDYGAVILATGSTPKVFSLGNDTKVHPAADILTGKVEAGQNVVVVGGGLVGCETALWLARQGKTVTIVEALDKLLAVNGPLCHANSEMLEHLIPDHKIRTICSATVRSVNEQGAVVATANGEELICADTVLLCVGYRSENSLYQQLRDEVELIWQVGDARSVANIMYAIWDAYEVASQLD